MSVGVLMMVVMSCDYNYLCMLFLGILCWILLIYSGSSATLVQLFFLLMVGMNMGGIRMSRDCQ